MKTSVLESILALIGLLSLASLGAIILFIPAPQNEFGGASVLVPILFSVSLFLFLGSLINFLGLWARKKFITPQNERKIVAIAFREGILISGLIFIYLWLHHFGVFKIWIALLLLAVALVVEYLILVRKNYGYSKDKF